jgi:hypothetical protein
VIVVADGGLIDSIVIQQTAGMAGVFAGNEVDLLERADRAERNVFQITDGSGDQK